MNIKYLKFVVEGVCAGWGILFMYILFSIHKNGSVILRENILIIRYTEFFIAVPIMVIISTFCAFHTLKQIGETKMKEKKIMEQKLMDEYLEKEISSK